MSGIEKHNKETGSWFCAVTHDLSIAETVKQSILDFPSWAWIYHESDTDEGTPHVHFLIKANGTRNIKQISDKIGLESNYIQVCRKVVAFRRYMLHLDSPDKIKYTVNDVHTRCHVDFREAEEGNKKRDVYDLFNDFCRLQQGTLTPQEFIQLNYVEMEKMPFALKIKTFSIINNTYMRTLAT